jgi:hypothetical protein
VRVGLIAAFAGLIVVITFIIRNARAVNISLHGALRLPLAAAPLLVAIARTTSTLPSPLSQPTARLRSRRSGHWLWLTTWMARRRVLSPFAATQVVPRTDPPHGSVLEVRPQ